MATDDDLPPLAQGLGWILAIPFFIWSTWTGIVIFTGGTVPVLGLDIEEGSLVWAVVWFAVLEWFAFLVVVGIPVLLLAGLLSGLMGFLRRSPTSPATPTSNWTGAPLLAAEAEWGTSVLPTLSDFTEGVVLAYADGLTCQAERIKRYDPPRWVNAGSAKTHLTWNQLESYGAKGLPENLVVSSITSIGYFIILKLPGQHEKDQWIQLLDQHSVLSA